MKLNIENIECYIHFLSASLNSQLIERPQGPLNVLENPN